MCQLFNSSQSSSSSEEGWPAEFSNLLSSTGVLKLGTLSLKVCSSGLLWFAILLLITLSTSTSPSFSTTLIVHDLILPAHMTKRSRGRWGVLDAIALCRFLDVYCLRFISLFVFGIKGKASICWPAALQPCSGCFLATSFVLFPNS